MTIDGGAQDTFDRLAAVHLRDPEVSLGRMLRAQGLKTNGKVFAFVSEDRLVVKLPADRAAALTSSGEAIAYRSGGRTMREWVSVEAPIGPAGHRRWRRLIVEARDHVGGGIEIKG